MTLPASPNSISFSQIQTEFGGSNPISLSEYYRGGTYVPTCTANGGQGLIATSGAISMNTFHGTSALKTISATFTNQGHTGGTPADTQFQLTINFAAMSPNNPSGNFAYSVTIATSDANFNGYTSSGNPTGNFTYGGTTNLLLNLAIPYTAGTITATISKSGYATYTSTLSFTADTSQSYAWTAQPTSLNEGSGSVFSIATSFPNATFRYQVYHNYITGYPNTDMFDLVETDTFTTNGSGNGSFTITPYVDLVTEGTEDFDVYVSYNGNSYPRLKSSNIVVNDTSTTPTLYGPYTPGTASFAVPTGMNYMSYILIGGGGGGGGSGGYGVAAGGGGSAGQVITTPWACAVPVTPGATVTFTVGAGGAGGANGPGGGVPGSQGGNGIDSSFTVGGTLINVAYGGGGGGGDHSGIGLKGGFTPLAGGGTAPYIYGGQGGSGAGGGGLGNGGPGTCGYQLLGYGYGGNGGSGVNTSLTLRFCRALVSYAVGAGGGGGMASSNTSPGPCSPTSGLGGPAGGGGGGGKSVAPDGLSFGSSGVGGPSSYGNGGGGAASTCHVTGAIGGCGSAGMLALYFFASKTP